MKMVRSLLLAVFALGAAASAAAGQGLAPYSAESDLLATTPSTDDGPIGAMFNPAQWGVPEQAGFAFFWSDANVRRHALDQWGFAGGRGLGYSVRRTDLITPAGARHVTDYQIGAGGGDGAGYGGMALGFSGGGKGLVGRSNFLSFGHIARPAPWLSAGLATRVALGDDDLDGVADLGIRPLSDPRLLLFGDYALRRRERWDDGALSGGVALRPIPGLQAAAKWSDHERLRVTLGITVGRAGFRASPSYQSGDRGATRCVASVNPATRGFDLDGRLNRGRRYLGMNLKGRAVYQGYRFLDRESIPLRRTTQEIDLAIKDPTVGGVAINLSGYESNLAMTWEVREKLLELKRQGKKVVVHCDRLSLPGYYLASVADRLIMDPMGGLLAPGVQVSRTYLKGTLEKIGIGFDEWRFFKFKSAMETFSRTDMSERDEEQLKEAAEAVYGEIAAGIAATGRVSRDEFDRTVNEEPVLSPRRLLELHWIDQIGRWEDVEEATRALAGRPVRLVSKAALAAVRRQPDETWGAPPTIALVYLVGDCAMDSGIRGRESSKALKAIRENRKIKAVVLRVDSPGGDPLPSDLVANETRAYQKARKRILVSQGRVAASGGYWISMDADSIAATPFTVTGSIGVIGGWYWNAGLGKKLGLTSDHVQVGRSADLMGGLRLPLLGAVVPERNLDEHERALAKRVILDLYDDFVKRVASSRRLEESYVREVGEGRIYMGRPGVERKIIDRVATLDETLESARRAAGIAEGRRVRVVEYPKAPFLRLPGFLSGARAGTGAALLDGDVATARPAPAAPRAYEAAALQQILDHPGQPLLVVPGSLLPDEPEAR